jgi:ribosomal protein S12 methylthiotransferase
MNRWTPLTKVGFVSLGCPKNLVDSEVMMGLLARDDFELTPHADEAEVIVVNTCSFIDPAKRESINTILEMAEHKKTGSAKRLIVAGCLVERYRAQIQEQIPEVDAVVGTNELERIVAVAKGETVGTFKGDEGGYLYHELTPRLLSTPRHSAYIKITEGCDHPCSFCVIPQIRGHFRSRRFESVISEASAMFNQGVKEINLIGQDTTWYGEDLGVKDGLPILLERLAAVPAASQAWVRFLYCYPNRITQKLLDTIAAHTPLVKYLDVPLQHASSDILKLMRRGQNGDQFLKLLARVRKTIPGVTIRTSMIVGFPGETERDFEILCQFVEEARFDRLGVFAYSDEEDSGSFALPGKVDQRTINRRRSHLMAIQKKISRAANKALVGSTRDLLVEGPSADSHLVWEGRLPGQAPEIDGKVLITDAEDVELQPGMLARAEITKAHEYDLEARVVSVISEGFRAPAQAGQGSRNLFRVLA